jgi:predicted hotdog family 3-hydroxylacyl-ACP dehydratase
MSDFPPVADLVPHAPPALALDELLAWRPGEATARITVREHGLLVVGDGVDACVTLELMAQTAAACLGYEAFRSGGGVRVGMVVVCRKLEMVRPRLLVGESFTVQARRARGSDFASAFEGEVRDASGELVARATITLVHPEQLPS